MEEARSNTHNKPLSLDARIVHLASFKNFFSYPNKSKIILKSESKGRKRSQIVAVKCVQKNHYYKPNACKNCQAFSFMFSALKNQTILFKQLNSQL